MARLPWLTRSRFGSPLEILSIHVHIAKENKYLGIFILGKFSYFIMESCFVYTSVSPHRGDSNYYTQHTIIL